eukprot:COSAG02_NODE_11164_length_1779_cov_1.875595_1_plen_259_part_00
MVYLTKSQRDSEALFLALPCRNCGCGIKARTLPFKREADAQGKDTHYKKTTCHDLKAEREAEQAGAAAGAGAAAAAPVAAAAAARQQQRRRRRRPVESGACVGLENVAPAQEQQQEQAQAQEQEQLKAEVKQLENALRQYGACVQLIFTVSLTLSRSLCRALQGCERAREGCERARERAHQPERAAGPGFTREGAAGEREEPASSSCGWDPAADAEIAERVEVSISHFRSLSHCLTFSDLICCVVALRFRGERRSRCN